MVLFSILVIAVKTMICGVDASYSDDSCRCKNSQMMLPILMTGEDVKDVDVAVLFADDSCRCRYDNG